jgi:regulator of RNase E activity RraA
MPAPDLSKSLYTAVLSDVLDSLGYLHQAMLSFIRPIDPEIPLFARVRTGLFEPRAGERPREHPYNIEIALIDDLKPGDVAVLACGGPTETITPWGELLMTEARARGAAGAVTDGLVRDARTITRIQFPGFHGGFRPLDSKGRGKMVARDTEVVCGVACRSGDLVFGDQDWRGGHPAGDLRDGDRARSGEDRQREHDAQRVAGRHDARRSVRAAPNLVKRDGR